jgi:hypothetical protein
VQRAGAPFPFVTVNTVGPTLMAYGSQAQKERYLPGILRGEEVWAIGYTEPGAGTDLASLRTKAVRAGDEWVVDGNKVYTSGAGHSDFIWLAVRTNPDRALRRPAVSLDGTRIAVTNAKSTELSIGRLVADAPLEAVPLPREAIVSPPSWDSSGDLWFIDRSTNRLQLAGRDSARVSTVQMPKISAGPLQIVRVGREGTRIAFAAGVGAASRFFLGSIMRGPNGSVQAIAGVHEVLPDVHGVRDIAWIDADTLIVVGNRSAGPVVALRTDTDGFVVDDTIDQLRGIAAMTGAPTDSKLPLVASTDAGQLQQWDPSLGWQPLGPGRDPVYPG